MILQENVIKNVFSFHYVINRTWEGILKAKIAFNFEHSQRISTGHIFNFSTSMHINFH